MLHVSGFYILDRDNYMVARINISKHDSYITMYNCDYSLQELEQIVKLAKEHFPQL